MLTQAKFNPHTTVVLGRPGAITPVGDGPTAYNIAVKQAKGWARLAASTGLIKAVGGGRYQTQDGQAIDPQDVYPQFGAKLKEIAGPRPLASQHLLLTDYAGQIPKGMKPTKAQDLGFQTRKQMNSLGLGTGHKMLLNATEDIYLMLSAAAMAFANNGYSLDTVFKDPKQLMVGTGRGLPGVESFIKLVQESMTGAQTAGGMLLPHTLQSAAMGVLISLIGPKIGDDFGVKFDPETGVPTMGRNFQMSAECATFGALMVNAAESLGMGRAGQVIPQAAMIGVGEAPLGTLDARIAAVGFDSLKAMEAGESVRTRGGYWNTYAPFTTDAKGFWPGEGGAFLMMYTLDFAVQNGLPLDSILAGWGAFPDEGGKESHPEIGNGILNSLWQAIRMGTEGHGITPNDIDWVNFHGTATAQTNKLEPKALLIALKAMGYQKGSKRIKASALKALLTHLLGAASGAEITIMLNSLREGHGPGMINIEGRTLDVPDEVLEYIDFSSDPIENPQVALAFSEGFSGNNVVLLLRAFAPQILELYGYTDDEIKRYQDKVLVHLAVAEEMNAGLELGTKTAFDAFSLATFRER